MAFLTGFTDSKVTAMPEYRVYLKAQTAAFGVAMNLSVRIRRK